MTRGRIDSIWESPFAHEVHASRLFTPHVVRFDERKRRRSDLRPVVYPVRGQVAESLSSCGDVCIRSTIIALLVRLFGDASVVPVEGAFLWEVQSKQETA